MPICFASLVYTATGAVATHESYLLPVQLEVQFILMVISIKPQLRLINNFDSFWLCDLKIFLTRGAVVSTDLKIRSCISA